MTDPSELADRPGVVALPPLIYLVTIVLAFVLALVIPLELHVSAPVRWVAGFLVVAGIWVSILGRGAFERAGTNVNPMQPSTRLVLAGPYRVTRNPMYVGMAFACVALAVATINGWLLVLLLPTWAVMHWGVILREERYLTRKFGSEYEEYRRRVRRYF
jgi:protein-S-isoprenylcysteine O-methyltransferase Ste14